MWVAIMNKVYCIGEMLIDFVAEKQGNDLSKAVNFTKKAGGAPANVACAVSKLGGRSAFIGCVGEDSFGTFLLQVLHDHNVDISTAQRCATFTTLAFVSLSEDGERDFVFSRGADKKLTYNPVIAEEFGGNLVHFGAATSFLGGSLEDAYARYYKDASEKGAFISFDPNYRGDLWRGNEKEFIEKCTPFIAKAHLCKFSKEEALLLSGRENLVEACDYFHRSGTQIITITLGADGTLLSTADLNLNIPSVKVNPVDTTGAGDAFIGCLLYQISTLDDPRVILEDNNTLVRMVEIANRAGAITTTQYGAIAALPGKGEVF